MASADQSLWDEKWSQLFWQKGFFTKLKWMKLQWFTSKREKMIINLLQPHKKQLSWGEDQAILLQVHILCHTHCYVLVQCSRWKKVSVVKHAEKCCAPSLLKCVKSWEVLQYEHKLFYALFNVLDWCFLLAAKEIFAYSRLQIYFSLFS